MIAQHSRVDELISLLDEAVGIVDECTRCHRIKDILHDITEAMWQTAA